MAKPRRGYLFPLDARVLSIGARLHEEGHDRFYGLQIARRLERERSSVYKSLHRLSTLGLIEERSEGHWERHRSYRLTAFGHASVVHARLGRRVFGRYRRRDG
jgi:DNA-binding PadR family transcriptional regulator